MKKKNLQTLLEEIHTANVKKDLETTNDACQRLGMEIYRRSLRKNAYRIVVFNPGMEEE